MKNLWTRLIKPFSVLAPMEEVTDAVFRQLILECSRPDVFFTEFVNVDALNSPGREEAMLRLKYQKQEHPIVAQIWGTNPENFEKATRDIKKLGFDGIDINMGCPQKKVVKLGAGAALINNHQLVSQIIAATKRGAGALPVSVKTRIGYKSIGTKEWISYLLHQNLDALTVHARTQKEMSKVPAYHDQFKTVISLRDKISPSTIIIGNGDIENYHDGIKLSKKYNLDGFMIGRGIFKDVYCFKNYSLSEGIPESKGYRKGMSSTRDYACSDNIVRGNPRTKDCQVSSIQNSSHEYIRTIKDKLQLALRHIELFQKTWGDKKNYQILKKYMKIYINGFRGASLLRSKLMQADNIGEMKRTIEKY